MDKGFDKRILILEYCNYVDYQIGGHLSMAKNLISAFKSNLALVGITTDKEDPVGKWFKKNILGVNYDYFALARYNKLKTKYLIPDRILCFLLLRYYKRKILTINIQNVFVQRHEIIPAIYNFGFQNICYRFPGLGNPLKISKYSFGKYLATSFDRIFFRCLRSAKLILASGDEGAISEMVQRSSGALSGIPIIQFPTRIDTGIFKVCDKLFVRQQLDVCEHSTILVTVGRLALSKGWKLMIDSFVLINRKIPDSYLFFIGEGEDRDKIIEYVSSLKLSDRVILTGKKNPDEIALYLNASDLFIMGSSKEGWSTSLAEAIACGIPSCVMNFSSAREIIREGISGYVIDERDETLFSQACFKALKLSRPVSNDNVLLFSTDRLKSDLLNHWTLI